MDEDFYAWFSREILVHEAALLRFLKRTWRNAADVPDLCHDTYVRVLEAAERQRPTSPKAFLFSTARNLVIDRARRARIVPIDLLQDMEPLSVLTDEVSPERTVSALQLLRRLTKAFAQLPERRREVVWLRKVEDIPQRDIARRMGITEATVEAHLVRGMRALMQLYHDEDAGAGGRTGQAQAVRANQKEKDES